jgi:hypothetical protein
VRSTRSAVNCSNFGAGQGHHQMFGTVCIRSQIRQVDFGLHYGGKFDLRFFRGFLQTLKRLAVVIEVNAVVFLEFSMR